MAYIYELEYTIHSVIENLDDAGLVIDEPEISITTSEGFFKTYEDRSVISYTESTEGGKVTTDITLAEGEITLLRRGAVVFDATFKEGEVYKTVYSVPPYSFDTEIKTKRIRADMTKAGGEIRLLYSMNIGGQEKSVRMKISARDAWLWSRTQKVIT